MRLALAFGAALLAAGPALHAQTGDRPAEKKAPTVAERVAKAEKACERAKKRMEKADFSKAQTAYRECLQRQLCAQEKDKAACNERVARRFETEDKARRACAGKKGEEPGYGECMRRERCAGANDPARCETRARALDTCAVLKDKGDAYQSCMRREICTQSADPARCEERGKARAACQGRTGDELRACMQEQRGKKK
jgi:hypothetical protein